MSTLAFQPIAPPPPSTRQGIVLDGQAIGFMEPAHHLLPGEILVALDSFLSCSERSILPMAHDKSPEIALRKALIKGLADTTRVLEALHAIMNRLDVADVTHEMQIASHP